MVWIEVMVLLNVLVTKLSLKSLQCCSYNVPACYQNVPKSLQRVCLLPKCSLKVCNVSACCFLKAWCLLSVFLNKAAMCACYQCPLKASQKRQLEYMSPKCPLFVTKHPHACQQSLLVHTRLDMLSNFN